MTWTPTAGLKAAESTVQTLLQDMATMGVHVTNPTLRWRMKQVIAEALDGFRFNIEPVAEFPLEERDEHWGNGSRLLTPRTPEDTDEYRATFPHDTRVAKEVKLRPGDDAIVTEHRDGSITVDPTPKAAKRRAGRPKGAKNKKAKAKAAKAAAETVEAAAS